MGAASAAALTRLVASIKARLPEWRGDGYDHGMLASRLLKATAVAICLWTLHLRAFAEERDAAPSPPKAEATKPARKSSVKDKTQGGGAPIAGNRPAAPPAAPQPGGSTQARPRPMRDENVRKAPPAPLPPPDIAKPPPRLPEASREKMRACAIEWSKLKLEAKNPMPLWRDFGAQCLKR
jgi:type IV secretory pathway VirB10-like protein